MIEKEEDEYFINKDGEKVMRQKTEIYSRVVGYIRPIQAWNVAKQEEFKDRKMFKTE